MVRARLLYDIQSQLDLLAPYVKIYSQLNSSVKIAVQRLAQRAKDAAETRKTAKYTRKLREDLSSTASDESDLPEGIVSRLSQYYTPPERTRTSRRVQFSDNPKTVRRKLTPPRDASKMQKPLSQ